jgi:hypothetical protein
MTNHATTAGRLEQVARISRTGDPDPGRIHALLTSMTERFDKQAQPPCTLRAWPQDAACHDWRGPSWGRHWYCGRRCFGGASISTPPTMKILTHGRVKGGGEEEEVCRT